jgi:hypothetical protein
VRTEARLLFREDSAQSGLGMRLAVAPIEGEDIMVHTITVHKALAGTGRFLEHAAAVVVSS